MINPGDKPDAAILESLVRQAKSVHYWTGSGTLCSLDNSREPKVNHTEFREAVTCKWCLGLLSYAAKTSGGRSE